MPSRSSVGVRSLAEYADDPVSFCERKGGVINAERAAAGDAAHFSAGRSLIPRTVVIAFVVAAAVACFAYFGIHR